MILYIEIITRKGSLLNESITRGDTAREALTFDKDGVRTDGETKKMIYTYKFSRTLIFSNTNYLTFCMRGSLVDLWG